mgnify:CR=1 FL=1
MFIDTRDALVAQLEKLAAIPGLTPSQMQAFATEVQLSEALLADLRRPDPTHPYGRNVVWACDVLECMVATWTPGTPCYPHDHGGSYGAVRVLQGQALHRIWSVQDNALEEVHHHPATPGDVLVCGPSMVHSMGDDAQPQGLMTLHLYTRAIDHMVVYDLTGHDTVVVEGSCGAWIPTEASGLLRSRIAGIHKRADLAAA